MFCPNCGAQNPDNTAFCANCGTNFAQSAAPVYGQPAAPVYGQPAAPVYGQPAYPVAPATVPGKGLGIASMVLGIIALVLFCTSWFAVACAVVGVVLGGVGLKKAKDAGMKNGMAVAGIVCSVIALAIDIIIIIWAYSTAASIMAMLS